MLEGCCEGGAGDAQKKKRGKREVLDTFSYNIDTCRLIHNEDEYDVLSVDIDENMSC